MSSLFLVYKSGAGSGKTYTLTREFLKLALKSEKPWSYKQILAVTFTKKAANEMKVRILDWLLELSSTNDLANNQKAKAILENATFGVDVLKKRASKMHEHILHHYSDFSVQTIDSFVHKLIKSFYRDLKLSSDFEVNMDLDDAINEVVSSQLREVGINKELTSTLQAYLLQKIDDEKSSRVSTDLNQFFKDTEDEKAQEALSKLSIKTFEEFTTLRKEISKKIKSLKEHITEKQKELFDLLHKLDGVDRHLSNWSKKPFSGFVNYGKAPVTAVEKECIYKVAFKNMGGEYDVVNTMSITIIENLLPVLDDYLLLSSLQKNIYALSLVQDFKKRFDTLKKENNMVMISDFNKMVNNVVKDNPAPFIYERLGERYHHYLIDEFQDTSLTQWSNFLPLISHCLASGRTTMLVGDSKQAIYRWRNGDFNLFADLPALKNPENSRFIHEVDGQLNSAYKPENLSSNYRSSNEVVEFNNRLFQAFSTNLSETGKKMYADFKQTPTKTADGYVEFKLFKKKTEDETEDWLAHILETINGVTQREFNLGDVAILTRNNKTLAQIADFLLEKGVSTTSQEGLLLVNNLDIKLILATLHACVYTEDEANSAQLFSLLEMKHGNVPDVLARHEFLEEYKSGKRTYKKINIWRYLEHLQGSKPVHSEWNRLSAYEAIIEITKYFCLNTKPNIFLETLKEISFLASRAGHKTVREFLTHWEQKHVKKGKGYSVSTTEDENAVKLMTIHKSKGLEFPVVIYAEPFYHGNTSKIWFDLSETSSPLEVNYSTKIFEDHQGKGFSKVHHQREKEITEQFIDDLNLFYVATTRASQNLFICGIHASNKLTAKKLFYQNFKSEFGTDLENSEVYTLGSKQKKRKKNAEENPKPKKLETRLESYSWKNRLAYRFSQSALKEDLASISERSLGISVHAQLARIETVTSISEVHNTLSEHIEDETILSGLKTLEQNLDWQKWFTTPLQIWNEKSLITHEGDELIPDRVMEFDSEIIVVDYKTGEKNKKYAVQINSYVNFLTNLFEKPVKGCLVYLKSAEIEKITAS